MNLIIQYEKKGEYQNLIVSIFLFRYIRIISFNLREYLLDKIEKYIRKNDNNLFPKKSYINYKNTAKIIWNRFVKLKNHIYFNSIDLNMCLGNDDPAKTAIIYGVLNGISPNIICFINKLITVENYFIRITPNFNSSNTNISLTCKVYINPIFITYQYISIKRRLKKDGKYQATSN